jgi:phosphatidate cytidylyltransferase
MTDAPDGSPPAQKKRPRFFGSEEFEARALATRAEIRAQVRATKAQIDATNIKIEARTGRNLPLAILIGLALGLAMLFSLIVVKELFMIVAGVIIAFTAFELASALRYAGRDVPRIPTVIAAVATVPAAFYWGDDGKWLITLAGIVFVAAWRLAELGDRSHRSTARDVATDLAAGTFIQVYVPFLASFSVLLAGKEGGQWWTLAFLLAVISVDTGAYASGLVFGKHAMAPRISPKKTWEGFAGSVLASLIAGVLLAIFMLHQEWWVGIIFGLTIVFTATVGDLTESLIKRDLGIKDISTWLPGHGGFLDRLDSILPSAAAAYVLFLIFT